MPQAERVPLIVGNWKMNGSNAANQALLQGLASLDTGDVEVVICPPALYCQSINAKLGAKIKLGAQNVAAFTDGAYTGEISATMLADCGVRFVIIGHSERRNLFHESEQELVDKFILARAAGLQPIFCVGESQAEREQGQTEARIGAQLRLLLQYCQAQGIAGEQLIIAYEPIWAIGTGRSASPIEAQQVHAFIRQLVAELIAAASALRLLYGGSVTGDNAAQIFLQQDIDGGLIGGASLQAAQFMQIINAAKENA